MKPVNQHRRRLGKWTYPSMIGVIIGVLIGGLTFRLSSHVPSSSALGTSSTFGTSGPGGVGNVDQSAGSAGGSGTSMTTAGGSSGSAPVGAAAVSATPGLSALSGSTAAGVTPGGATPVTAAGGHPGLTASDVGVTPTTISIGVALLDLGGASQFGASVPGYDPKVQQQEWQTYIDYLNKSGGILGRSIHAYYQDVNVLDSSASQAACLQFTQTDHVFLVFSGATMANGDGDLCVAAENHTLDVTSGSIEPTQFYQEAGGLLISSDQAGNRFFGDWARVLQHLNKLKGHKLGLLVDQGDAQTMANSGLIPALRSMGYQIAYTAAVSSDPSQGPAEAAPQVEQMRATGVDTVIMATAFYTATAFANDADNQGWKPQYVVSDYDGLDVGTLDNGMPSGFSGAIAISDFPSAVTTSHPESPKGVRCRQEWDAATGQQLSTTDSNYGPIEGICYQLSLLTTAAQATGPDLTRSRFTAAVQGFGRSFDFGGLGGSFGPGKTDYEDFMRAFVWSAKNGSETNCNGSGSMCWNDDIPPYDPES